MSILIKKSSITTQSLALERFSNWIFLSLISLFIFTGLIGINFGEHWDEYIQYGTVTCSLKSGFLLPCAQTPDLAADYGKSYYNYPSLTYWASLVAYFLGSTFKHNFINSDIGLSLNNFRMVARPLFLILSSLSGVWLYLAFSKNNRFIALIAVSIQLLSWEFAYHARWIAPDAVMTQFCALWLMSVAKAQDPTCRSRWMIVATIAAALATATKYTAGAFLPATGLFICLCEPQALRQGKAVFKKMVGAIILFLTVFIIVTPGAVLEPLEFINDVAYEMHHYASGHNSYYGVAVYNVSNGFWSFAGHLGEYLSFALTSHLPVPSFMLMLTAGIGLIHLFQTKRRALAITLISTIIFYICLFSGRTVVFMVRNYLFFLPLFAFLIANGVEKLSQYSRFSRAMVGILVLSVITLNTHNLFSSALSIRSDVGNLSHLLVAHIKAHPQETFALSESLSRSISPENLFNVVSADTADTFVYRQDDLRQHKGVLKLNEYSSTHHNTFQWLGSREVNYNYYVSWIGRDRILLVPAQKANRMGLMSAFSGRT